MMARVLLQSLCSTGRSSPTIALDGDCGCGCPEEPDPTIQTFTIRARDRDGYDSDGNPLYRWSDLFTGAALEWEWRQELDDVAGTTRVTGDLVVVNSDGIPVPETSVAVDPAGIMWRILSTEIRTGAVKLRLERVDHDG